jgi:hypothetical protein
MLERYYVFHATYVFLIDIEENRVFKEGMKNFVFLPLYR